MIAISRQELGVLRLALETQERVMTERARPAAAASARLLRDRLVDARRAGDDPSLDVDDDERPCCIQCGQYLPEDDDRG